MQHGKLVFIGGGNMAASLIGGLIAQGYPASRITASDPFAEARTRLAAQFGVAVTTDNRAAVADADIVVLAVKPQVMAAVVAELAPAVPPGTLVISIAAGVPIAALAQLLGPDVAIVRCMPNTPALVRVGATGLHAGAGVSTAQRRVAADILGAVGTTVWVESERDIDAVTAVSGSGPAYFFRVMEAMIAAGVALGLQPEVAGQLTLQTALGAARMALDSDVDVAELRRRVTSPGGTTAAALAVLDEGGLSELFGRALAAADARGREMGAATLAECLRP